MPFLLAASNEKADGVDKQHHPLLLAMPKVGSIHLLNSLIKKYFPAIQIN